MRGVGRAWFAVILLGIAGTLNVIYGIAAISDSKFFVGQTRYVFSDLHTWGWVTLILGVIQLVGAISLTRANFFGLFVGIAAAGLGALEALLNVGGAYPFWSLGIFAMCLLVIHGLVVYGIDMG